MHKSAEDKLGEELWSDGTENSKVVKEYQQSGEEEKIGNKSEEKRKDEKKNRSYRRGGRKQMEE